MKTQKDEVLEMKTYQIETRVALLEQSICHITETLIEMKSDIRSGFEKIDKRLDKMDGRLDKMDGRLDKMDERLYKVDNRLWVNFYWILGTMIGLACIVCGVMAKGFEWF